MDDLDFVLKVLKEYAPIDGKRTKAKKRTTGNLKFYSILPNYNNGTISIGPVASPAMRYAAFTNLPWKNPRYRGAKNPNEQWIEMAIEEAEKRLNKKLNLQVYYEEHER
jgi:hypothetical protein